MENKKTLPAEELREAIQVEDLERVCKAISRGADLTSVLPGVFYTSVELATSNGLPDILETLIKAGAPVPTNALAPLGEMDITDWKIDPIELEPVYARVVEILIAHGASPSINNYEGKPLIEHFPAKYYPNIHRILSGALIRSRAKP